MLALLSPTAEAWPLLASCETMWPDRRQGNRKCPRESPVGCNFPEGVSLGKGRSQQVRHKPKSLSLGVEVRSGGEFLFSWVLKER